MTDVKKIFDDNISPSGFKEWGYNKTLREILDECNNENWLLWILSIVLGVENATFIYIKANCANLISNIINNSSVQNAIDKGIDYGNGVSTYEEYVQARNIAATTQKEYSDLALETTSSDYLLYCVKSMACRWIYDDEGYGIYNGAVELYNIIEPSYPDYNNDIKPIILDIIKTNTKNLN